MSSVVFDRPVVRSSSRPQAAAPKTPPPAETAPAVVSCYDVLQIMSACGCPDFTDGKYDSPLNNRAAYLAAQQRQADYLLDQIDCKAGMRILDIGCGYGRILEAAKARGAQAIGITISPPQVADNRRRGLEVYLCNYRNIFSSGAYDGWQGSFDGIIANGSLEHFVQPEDVAAGRADAMYAEFFDVCRRLLKPGGKLATTAIHARRVGQIDPRELLKGPQAHPRGSELYHAANGHQSFGGWYPEPGQLEHAAFGDFDLVSAQDGTEDYWRTSEYWVKQVRRALLLDPRTWPTAIRTFLHRPVAAWRMMKCLLIDQSWNYQFRSPAPAQLWRHTWQAV